jgi:L-asparaginase
MFIRFITTGGTIDKIYFDALSQFEVGESQVEHILKEGLVQFDYEIVSLLQKDSLEITDDDRAELRSYVENDDASLYVITHGTDTMAETAEALQGLDDKTIVDAIFNVGMAVAAVQVSPPGVYIAMSGQVFAAGEVRKNRAENRFESIRSRGQN